MDTASPSKHSVHCAPMKSDTLERGNPTDRYSRNPYLNFLRHFRKQNCGLSAVEIIKKGAQAWKCLPKEKKLHFIEEAFYAPKPKKRRKNYLRAKPSAPFPRGRIKKSNRKMDNMLIRSPTPRARTKLKRNDERKRRGGVRW